MSTTQPLKLEQSRYGSVSSSGEPRYGVETIVTSNPEYVGQERLKDPNVFVYSLANGTVDSSVSPRFATLADMDLLHSSIDRAVSAGHTEYRSNTLTILYSDLDTAVAGAQEIRDAISNLTQVRVSLLSDFIGSTTEVLPYLVTGSTKRDTTIQAYSSAKAARIAAEAELATVNSNYSASQLKKDYLTQLQTLSREASGRLQAISDAVTKMYRDLYRFDPGDETPGDLLVTDADGSSMYLASYVQQTYIELNQKLSLYNQLVEGASATLDSYLSGLKNSQASVDDATEAEAAALSDLRTFCPDIDPSTL